jgi:CheY-like chemotaxis protein
MTTPLRGVHVAVVGDERDALDFLTQTLRYHGALVTHHDSARSVLRLMQLLIVNVVVVDIGELSDVSLKVITTIRALPARVGGRVPIVVLYAGPSDAEPRIVAADVDSVIRKPVQAAELAHTVAMVYAASTDPPAAEERG